MKRKAAEDSRKRKQTKHTATTYDVIPVRSAKTSPSFPSNSDLIMATPLVEPFPAFPADALLREGPAEGAAGGSAKSSSAKASDVVASSSKKNAVLVYCLRRPGCILCRATALRLAALAAKLEDDLGVSIICVANAWLPAEIDAFVKDFWKSSLKVFLDEEKAFFAVLGNGSLRRGSLLSFANPFSRVYANARKAKKTVKEHNLIGDGLLLGGLLAVCKSQNKKNGGQFEIVGGFQETTFGDAPTDEQVLELAQRAVEAAK